jgi:hypothetical protein
MQSGNHPVSIPHGGLRTNSNAPTMSIYRIAVSIPHGRLRTTQTKALNRREGTIWSPSHTVGLELMNAIRMSIYRRLYSVSIPHGGLRTGDMSPRFTKSSMKFRTKVSIPHGGLRTCYEEEVGKNRSKPLVVSIPHGGLRT